MTLKTPLPFSADEDDLRGDSRYWWQHLTWYHWFVVLVASMAWFFDCLDQRIFSLARNPALNALKANGITPKEVQDFGKVVTAFFLIGWGVGGMIFGALGDKFGRTRMLTTTILIYSVFTGLSFFSRSWWDFTLFRFLTGFGVGGVFGLAVALIAETVPSVARTQSLGLLQILSAVGNVSASFVMMGITKLETLKFLPTGQGWRYMFLVGAAPALMVIFTGRFLREPEPWLRLKERGLLPKGSIFVPYVKLFRERRWRRNLIVGALIASTGVVGLWAIGEYAVDLQRNIFSSYFAARVPRADVLSHVNDSIAIAFLLTQLGAVAGMWIFTRIALAAGRRLAFFIGFSAALLVTVMVYWKMSTPQDAYWMMPLMGAAQLSVFAGFSIYLPELFPSGMRSTGTSFCYNLGRFAAAGGSFFSAALSQGIFKNADKSSPLPLRYSAMSMCVIFLVGIATLPFAPETRGKPLPEDS
ncbi:MAG TPA: MFS transporter [Tepidisphaeraceae bacterium]|jgi:MFS family permease|nr:MFS transporter [Tepidisphaeraceae bacterium]